MRQAVYLVNSRTRYRSHHLNQAEINGSSIPPGSRSFVAGAFLLGSLLACGSGDTPPTSPIPPAMAQLLPTPPAPSRGIEDTFLQAERSIPGFGGFYFTESEDVVLYLQDTARSVDARSRVLEILVEPRMMGIRKGSGTPRNISVRQGSYSFSELVNWQRRILEQATSNDRITGVDADESANRVTLFVNGAASEAHIEGLAARAGVPRAAILVKPGGIPSLRASVQDHIRPLGAGIEIKAVNGYGSICSIGAIATFRNISANQLVTASHCVMGGSPTSLNLKNVWQKDTTVSQHVGSVLRRTPGWSTTGCASGASYCRYVDAVVVTLHDTVSASKRVAETTGLGYSGSFGTLNIGLWRPVQGIVTLGAGAWVLKTGRTSGTTAGSIEHTCVSQVFTLTGFGTTLFEVQCTNVIEGMGGDGGDSGGPVWTATYDGYANMTGIFIGAFYSAPENKWRGYYNDWRVIESFVGDSLFAQ